jgi:hypothetical protein
MWFSLNRLKMAALVTTALVHLGFTAESSLPTFDHSLIGVTAGFDDATATVDFPFINDGTEPFALTDIDTTCSCTTAALTQKIYHPGERGIVHVIYTVGESAGTVDQHINVHLAHRETVVPLTMRVIMPTGPRITPIVAFWPISLSDAPATTQVIDVTFPADSPYSLSDVQSTNAVFTLAVTAHPSTRSYQIAVTPTALTTRQWGTINLKTDHHKIFHIFAKIGSD